MLENAGGSRWCHFFSEKVKLGLTTGGVVWYTYSVAIMGNIKQRVWSFFGHQVILYYLGKSKYVGLRV